ncbi:acyl-CoA dehydrogenase family protein [Oleomonas cavernae]|uniref:acyl-CoA dehydrogenase family protein n=1 Tax=Oleomonas cavernae TaxID=2320859 RepID=UPI001F2F78D2|nr:acyl-CoA dehydrogenase family protein [Oleomonas cavernae]
MKLAFSADDEKFRAQIAGWMADNLTGRFEVLKNRGGPGDEHAYFDLRCEWEKHLGAAGWTGVGWPQAAGGRGAPLSHQVIFYEEYARAGGPAASAISARAWPARPSSPSGRRHRSSGSCRRS